ncbi:NAD-dependent epimerase/dehydratase family protein [Balneolaceae bacterium YR4-1]|uniref:NAD-dependent epimerase/dehydratase family protein n=1 Tax=Halalkalibaculum roseum TaxID=2709311 RepID=A0A6M1SUY1_9BACT|nr:NAD-dependent epimerase/dehydratase family protein [Halalkalibaculum roseum]
MIRQIFETYQPAAVIYLVAKSLVDCSIDGSGEFIQAIIVGAHNMLGFARERDIKHFIFASFSSVYGTNKNVSWSEDDHELKPISLYASTKVSGDLMGHVYS